MNTVKKTADLILFLADNNQKEHNISHMKLQKLLYYVQGYSLVFFGRPFFEEKILAYTHGPAVQEIEKDPEYSGWGKRALRVRNVCSILF